MTIFDALARGPVARPSRGASNAASASAPAVRSLTQHVAQQGNAVPAEHEFYAEDHPSEATLAALARKHFDVAVTPAQRSRA